MRIALLVPMGVFLVGACGGGEDDASDTSADSEQVVIETSVNIAATERNRSAGGEEPLMDGRS